MKLLFSSRSEEDKKRINDVTQALTGDKFCVTCKWILPITNSRIEHSKCRHPSLILKEPEKELDDNRTYLVTGVKPPPRPESYQDRYCLTMRDTGGCGTEGKLWEPK